MREEEIEKDVKLNDKKTDNVTDKDNWHETLEKKRIKHYKKWKMKEMWRRWRKWRVGDNNMKKENAKMGKMSERIDVEEN